ncbi:MAG: thiopeptide-type bacteriocin biosynthesis protein [Bacteroidota bacterium]
MANNNTTARRSFIPGSEWLYYKLYTGSKTSDRVLTELILPFSQEMKARKLINRWFFIRYGDPDNHLRIRFHLTSIDAFGHLVEELTPQLETFYDQQLIWKIQTDVYKRELERYGHQNISHSEDLFYHESEMLANLLSVIDGEEGEEIRWLFGLRAIFQLLEDFALKTEEKIALMEHLKSGFMSEFGIGKPTKRQLDSKFRAERAKIDWFMQFTRAEQPDYAPLLDILDQKSNRTRAIIQQITQNVNSAQRKDLLMSYIHMMMNRLFRSQNRKHELVMYYLLWRTLVTGQKRAEQQLV